VTPNRINSEQIVMISTPGLARDSRATEPSPSMNMSERVSDHNIPYRCDSILLLDRKYEMNIGGSTCNTAAVRKVASRRKARTKTAETIVRVRA
jgi:hypothetical protein